MKDFRDITVSVCKETLPTASLILPLTDKIFKKCRPVDGDTALKEQIKSAISKNFCKRYQNEQVREYFLTCACTALDPRTKSQRVVGEDTVSGRSWRWNTGTFALS